MKCNVYKNCLNTLVSWDFNSLDIVTAPEKSVDTCLIKTKWIDRTVLDLSWEPLTLHEARGFPVYYIYLNDIDSSGPVNRKKELIINTTESSNMIGGLDSSLTYLLAIGVGTDGGYVKGLSKTGIYTYIYI